MMFMNSEARSRAQYVDDVVMETIANLERKDVSERLGPGVTEGFLELLNWAVVPNQKNNTLSLPQQYEDSDVLPVMAFERNDNTPYLDKSLIRQTELQQKKVAEKLLKLGSVSREFADQTAHAISDSFTNTDEPMRILSGRKLTNDGFTGGSLLSIGLNPDVFTDLGTSQHSDKRIFLGMPIVSIVKPDYDDYTGTVTLLHELQHAVQHNMDPVVTHAQKNERFSKQALRQELEAYYVGREYSETLFESGLLEYVGRTALLGNNKVDDIRRENADYPGSMDPTDKVYDALVAADLNIL